MIEGKSEKSDTEIHFMKVESVMEKYDLVKPLSSFRKLIHDYRNPERAEFGNWYVTDFDNFLEGNPHI